MQVQQQTTSITIDPQSDFIVKLACSKGKQAYNKRLRIPSNMFANFSQIVSFTKKNVEDVSDVSDIFIVQLKSIQKFMRIENIETWNKYCYPHKIIISKRLIHQLEQQKPNEILADQQTILDTKLIQIAPYSSKIQQDRTKIKKEQQITSQSSIPKIINEFLNDNISQIAKLAFPQINQQKDKFNLSCAFCSNMPLYDHIYACQQNLSLICCKQCKVYSHYLIPLSLIKFCTELDYNKDRKKEVNSIQIQQEFNSRLQVQAEEKDSNIQKGLEAIPNLII